MCDFWQAIETFDPYTADPHFCWALLEMETEHYITIRNGKITPTRKCEFVSAQAILDRPAPLWKCKTAKGLLMKEAEGSLSIDGGACKLTKKGVQEVIDYKIDQAIAKAKESARSAVKTGRNDACPCGSGLKFKQCCLRRYRPH